MNLIGLILVFAIIIGYELPELLQKRQWREVAVFSGLIIFGFTISYLQMIGVTLPNPVKAIEFLTDTLIGLFAR